MKKLIVKKKLVKLELVIQENDLYLYFMALQLYNPENYKARTTENRKIFFSVQFSLYLKISGRGIRSQAERDMIEDLLSVYWEELDKSGLLDGKSLEEKIMICSELTVYFPYTEVPDYLIRKSFEDQL